MAAKTFQLLNLDRNLAKDADGRHLRQLREQLTQGRAQARRLLDSGVAPAEYQRLQTIVAGYDTGLELLPRLWEQQQ